MFTQLTFYPKQLTNVDVAMQLVSKLNIKLVGSGVSGNKKQSDEGSAEKASVAGELDVLWRAKSFFTRGHLNTSSNVWWLWIAVVFNSYWFIYLYRWSHLFFFPHGLNDCAWMLLTKACLFDIFLAQGEPGSSGMTGLSGPPGQSFPGTKVEQNQTHTDVCNGI